MSTRDLSNPPETLLDPLTRVIHAALTHAKQLRPDDVMVVGAWCRDAWHHALGHTFATAMTHDLDLAVALSSWDAYKALANAFPRVGDTGIRFRIADVTVDLIPFGDIEHPDGTVLPPTRDTGLSVWAFEEIFQATRALDLPDVGAVRIPTVAGFAAAKLGAWLDRSAWLEVKDAADLGLVLHWYAESTDILDRLYDTPAGNEVLISEATDVPLAAAHLLGLDVTSTIGPDRTSELLDRWPGQIDLLLRELVVRGGPTRPDDMERRRVLIDALTRGLDASPT
jgi:predicted nucleotidyltransferase